jgi:hypothetical protein
VRKQPLLFLPLAPDWRQAEVPRLTLISVLQRQAEIALIRGLMAQQQGDPENALRVFQNSMQLSQDLNDKRFGYKDRSVALRYAKAIKKARTSK